MKIENIGDFEKYRKRATGLEAGPEDMDYFYDSVFDTEIFRNKEADEVARILEQKLEEEKIKDSEKLDVYRKMREGLLKDLTKMEVSLKNLKEELNKESTNLSQAPNLIKRMKIEDRVSELEEEINTLEKKKGAIINVRKELKRALPYEEQIEEETGLDLTSGGAQ